MWTNQNLSFTRATGDMILLAEAILKGEVPDGAVVSVDEGEGRLALVVG